MGGTVVEVPNSPAGGVPEVDIYKVAVDEYRFQAQFNWSRTQYLLVFNFGIFAAAAGLLSLPGRGAAFVFLVGLVAAVLSIAAVHVMHGYYRAARDRMRRVEEDVVLPSSQRVDSTATLGRRVRRISVNQIIYLLLGVVALADLLAGVYALTR